jgi:hypothetical protein
VFFHQNLTKKMNLQIESKNTITINFSGFSYNNIQDTLNLFNHDELRDKHFVFIHGPDRSCNTGDWSFKVKSLTMDGFNIKNLPVIADTYYLTNCEFQDRLVVLNNDSEMNLTNCKFNNTSIDGMLSKFNITNTTGQYNFDNARVKEVIIDGVKV